ncbi:membrane hypothetical protein [Candidatus Sulfopaludibacter sp. SbA3]|nr:membrane hypothetical protein [Candidatus Sulfopaludibacter sp. SbA3]
MHEDMKQGVNGLATVASLAPWVGLFGTVMGIAGLFRGVNGDKTAFMAWLMGGLSLALWPTALGILVGLTSLWCYRHLNGNLKVFDREMENASLQLVNQLTRYQGPWTPAATIQDVAESPMFGESSQAELERDRKFWNGSMILTSAALLLSCCAHVPYFLAFGLSPGSVALAACTSVLFTFGASCFLTYPIWVKLLHRRRGGLVLLGSLLCLCWCVGAFFLLLVRFR